MREGRATRRGAVRVADELSWNAVTENSLITEWKARFAPPAQCASTTVGANRREKTG
jgi:hypothetical protein